jgi:hypothetical protein
MSKLAMRSVTLLLAMAAAGCGPTVVPTTAPGATTQPVVASAATTNSAPAAGAIVTGTFKSGRMQVTLTGAQSGQVDLPSLSTAAGAPGSTGIGPGYQWYQDGDSGAAVKIRFPGDPVTTGTTASLPGGTGIQVEFDVLASAGDLFSSSHGECTITFEENDQTALRGSLDCHGIPGSTDPSKTLDAKGTFEAHP